MKIEYDKEVDIAYIRLSDNQIITSEEVVDDIVYDYDKDYNIVGIEILFVKKRLPEEIKSLNFPFSEEIKQQFNDLFSTVTCT